LLLVVGRLAQYFHNATGRRWSVARKTAQQKKREGKKKKKKKKDKQNPRPNDSSRKAKQNKKKNITRWAAKKNAYLEFLVRLLELMPPVIENTKLVDLLLVLPRHLDSRIRHIIY
jgi:sortase (surface protein transpeptidase)